jgi:hypothetical protein
MNMPTEAFLTALYTRVDDWYKQHAPDLLAGKAGAKPLFSDSEVITLSIAQHWLGVPDEREFLRRVRNDWLPLFPRLVSQGQFKSYSLNRRARGLCWLIERMRQHLVERMGVTDAPCQLIDGTPVRLRHWRRYGPGHLLLPEAALGHCASKKETYYGFRLLARTTLGGGSWAGTCSRPTWTSATVRWTCWTDSVACASWGTRASWTTSGRRSCPKTRAFCW